MIREKTKLVKVDNEKNFDKAMKEALSDIKPKDIRAIQIFPVQCVNSKRVHFVSIRQAVIIHLYDTDEEEDDEEYDEED